jgi:uncharacterized membrane protein
VAAFVGLNVLVVGIALMAVAASVMSARRARNQEPAEVQVEAFGR